MCLPLNPSTLPTAPTALTWIIPAAPENAAAPMSPAVVPASKAPRDPSATCTKGKRKAFSFVRIRFNAAGRAHPLMCETRWCLKSGIEVLRALTFWVT